MRTLISTMFLLAGGVSLYAQNVAINTTGAAANNSAMLDISSTNTGILVPRIALTATNVAAPVTTPAGSLLIYNTATAGAGITAVTPGYYYWDGAQWLRFQASNTSNSWTILGNAGTAPATNFIGTTDAVDFVTRTFNVERMRVTSAGRVGIGTPAPGYTLDLANGSFGFGNNNSRSETRDNAGLQGNVGAQSGFFETVSPVNYPAGATSWWHLIDTRHSNTGNNYAMQIAGSFFDQRIYFRKTNNNPAQAWTEILTTANGVSGTCGTVNYLPKMAAGNSIVCSQVFDNGTNVGIGTGTPAVLLSVGGTGLNVYNTGMWIENNIHVQGNEALVQGGGRGRLRIGTAWGYVGLYAEVSGVTNTDLVLGSSSGLTRIGNGTGQNLFVSGQTYSLVTSNVYERAVNANGIWPTESFDNGTPGTHIFNSESEQGGFWANGNYSAIYNPADNDLVKFMDEDYFTNAGTIYDNNAMRSRIDGNGQYFQISDKNLKENIVPITGALDKVKQINGYTYQYKLLQVEKDKGQQPVQAAGILAQELALVLPEAVSSHDGTYMVNYAAIIPLLIEAIQEQNEIIKRLEEKINTLGR